MSEFLCTRGGKPATATDLEVVRQFGEFLERTGEVEPVDYRRDRFEPARRPLKRLVAECDAARWARLRAEAGK